MCRNTYARRRGRAGTPFGERGGTWRRREPQSAASAETRRRATITRSASSSRGPPAGSCWRGWASAYVDLGRLRRLELRPRRGRLGRDADRHRPDGDDVHLHGLRRSPSCRRRSRRPAAGTASAAGPSGSGAASLTGTAILIEYAMAPAAIVVFIGGYVESLGIFGITSGWPVYLAFYVDLRRDPAARRRRGAQGHVRHHRDRGRGAARVRGRDDPRVQHLEPDRHQAGHGRRRARPTSCPFGWQGIWAAFPFAIWFFLAVEGVSLAAEETRDPKKDMPRGLITAMLILLVFAALMLIFAPGGGGADAIKGSDNPLPAAIARGQGQGQRCRRLRQRGRARRSGGQLLLDHLRLLAPAVRALALRLPAARAVRDLEPQGAEHRLDRSCDYRLLAGSDHARTGRPCSTSRSSVRRVIRADDALPTSCSAGGSRTSNAATGRRAASRPPASPSCSRRWRWWRRSWSTSRRR